VKLTEITHLSEPIDRYTEALDGCDTLADLRSCLDGWRPLANDAADIADGMSEEDFTAFKKALRCERRGKFSGEIRFLPIIMPEILFQVAMVSHQYHVPWGLAYIRLRDVGRIIERAGRAVFK
jgi:hypothetical protein